MSRPTSIFDLIRMLLLPVAFLLSIYVGKLSLAALMDGKSSLVKRYVTLNGNAEAIKHSSPLIVIADNIKAMIPSDACVEVSRVPVPLLLSFRYYVYPIKFVIPEVNDFHSQPRVCNGRYFIDLNGQIKKPPATWRELPMRNGVRLYAIGASSVNLHPKIPITPQWSSWAYFSFTIIGFLIGCFLLCGLIPQVGEWPLSGKISCSFLLGFIGVTFPFWILSLFQVPLTDVLVYIVFPALLIVYYFFMQQRGGSLRSAFAINKFTIASVMCNSIGMAAIIFYFFLIVSFPIGIVDEVHIWILKSKIFFDLRVLNFDYTEIITNYYPVFLAPIFNTSIYLYKR